MKTRILSLSDLTPEAINDLIQKLKGVNIAVEIGNSFQLSGLIARNFREEKGYLIADIVTDPSLSKNPIMRKVDILLGFERKE